MLGLFNKKAKFYIWQNPDGTLGGEVSEDAVVDPSATIGRHATVLSGAHIRANQVVPIGAIVEATGTVPSFGTVGIVTSSEKPGRQP